MSTRRTSGSGETTQAPLGRFAACHPCRRSKRKCDAVRPICGPCQNPYRRTGGACTWDERIPAHPEGSTERKGCSPMSEDEEEDPRQSALTARPDKIDAIFAARRRALLPPSYTDSNQPPPIPPPLPSEPSSSSRPFPTEIEKIKIDLDVDVDVEGAKDDFELMVIEPRRHAASDDDPPESPLDMTYGRQVRISPHATNVTPGGLTDVGADMNDRSSRNLPSRCVLEHVINVFFEKVPLAPHMLSRSRLLTDLQLPPNHSRAPAEALLHAILAITARFLSPHLLESRPYTPPSTQAEAGTYGSMNPLDPYSVSPSSPGPNDALTRFEIFHRTKALESFMRHSKLMTKLLDAMRAHIIVSMIDHFNARPSGFFTNAGISMRIAVAMQLNESPNVPADSWNRYNHQVIHPSLTPLEQADRDRVFWGAWLMDRHVILMGNWAPALGDDEIAVELPVTQVEYESGQEILTGCQTIRSPDLFNTHPKLYTDSFVLLIKATVLQSDAAKFLRDYSRDSHSVMRYLEQPKLWEIISKLQDFQRTFPAELRKPTKGGTYDRTLLAAVWIIHGVHATLGEPIIEEAWTSALAKATLWEIRAALSLLHDVITSSFDVTLFPGITAAIWFTCSRVLCRFVDAATAVGDLASASVFTQEVQIFRQGLQLYSKRHLYGLRNLQRLDVLLQVQGEVGDITGKLAFDTSAEESSFPVLRQVTHPPRSGGDIPMAYEPEQGDRPRGVSLTVGMGSDFDSLLAQAAEV